MKEKGQLMGVPVKLVIALVIGVMVMGILTQFVDTADRTMMKDMKVNTIVYEESKEIEIDVDDAQSGDPVYGPTIQIDYPGGSIVRTLKNSTSSYTFDYEKAPSDTIASIKVTQHGYIPWKGEIALP